VFGMFAHGDRKGFITSTKAVEQTVRERVMCHHVAL
jgi:hypothetical protein